MAWLNGWTYRKSHTINAASGAGTGYQVLFKVYYGSGTDGTEAYGSLTAGKVYCYSKCKTDFGDIRFTLSNGTTQLPYWIQEKADCNYALIWVKITDNLSSSPVTIYVYFGNASASTTTNGKNTFIIFDNFDNLNDWTIVGPGNVTIDNSPGFNCAYAENTHCGLMQMYTHGNIAVLHRARVGTSSNYNRAKIVLRASSNIINSGYYQGDFGYISNYPSTNEGYRISYTSNGKAVSAFNYDTTAFYVCEFRIYNNYMEYEMDITDIEGSAPNKINWTDSGNVYPTGDRILLSFLFAGKTWYDWVAVRKWQSTEPSHGAWGFTEVNGTIVVPTDGLYSGSGSKQMVIQSSADPIIDVQSNLSDITKSAVIENLVIWGTGNNTGIRLQNVYNCQIRNVTIVNCYRGIKLTATGSGWTQSNHIKHVRMAYVTNGIEFVPGGTNNFGFTHIDDVGISLKNEWMQTGIVIGNGCKPYSSFIKANVWSTQPCDGMWVDGLVNLCLINFNHEKTTTGKGGSGVHIASNGTVGDNHSFFLSTGNMQDDYWIHDESGHGNDIIERHY
jgi:hypothetical protein